MRKITALFLLAFCLCCMCACSDDKNSVSFAESSDIIYSESEQESYAESSEAIAESSDMSEESDEASDEASGEASDDISTETSEPETETEVFGVIVGDRYVNTFAGIGFSLRDGWGFASFEELMQINKITTENFEEKYKDILLETNVFFDMYAANNKGSYASVVFEKMNESQKLNFTDTSKVFSEATIRNFEQSLEENGALNVEYEVTAFKVDRQMVDGIHATYIQSGYSVEMYMFCLIKGDYIITCSAYAANGEDAEELRDCFQIN